MAMTVRMRDDLGQWRSLRQAARWAQAVAGLAVLVNVAALLWPGEPSRSPAVWALNYAALFMIFFSLAGGFWAERRARRDHAE